MSETSIVERAYADLEARQKEADALNRGERPNAGTFRSRAEFEERDGDARTEAAAEAASLAAGSVAREIMEGAKEERAVGVQGLAGRVYSALFRTDLEPETITFHVEDKECFVTLLRMDKAAHDKFLQLGGAAPSSENFSPAVDHLVGVTVQDFCLWAKQPGSENWQQHRPPANASPEKRVQMLRGLQILPEVFDAIFGEVVRVNQATETDRGN